MSSLFRKKKKDVFTGRAAPRQMDMIDGPVEENGQTVGYLVSGFTYARKPHPPLLKTSKQPVEATAKSNLESTDMRLSLSLEDRYTTKEPQNTEQELQKKDKEPQDHDKKPKDYDKKPKDYDKKPQDYDKKPQDYDKKPQDYHKKAQDYNKKPKDKDKEPQDIVKELQRKDKEPQDSDKKPQDKDKKPQENGKESQDSDPKQQIVDKEERELQDGYEQMSKLMSMRELELQKISELYGQESTQLSIRYRMESSELADRHRWETGFRSEHKQLWDQHERLWEQCRQEKIRRSKCEQELLSQFEKEKRVSSYLDHKFQELLKELEQLKDERFQESQLRIKREQELHDYCEQERKLKIKAQQELQDLFPQYELEKKLRTRQERGFMVLSSQYQQLHDQYENENKLKGQLQQQLEQLEDEFEQLKNLHKQVQMVHLEDLARTEQMLQQMSETEAAKKATYEKQLSGIKDEMEDRIIRQGTEFEERLRNAVEEKDEIVKQMRLDYQRLSGKNIAQEMFSKDKVLELPSSV